MSKVALMLNTCDKFSDLWPLFFDCLYKFWNPKYPVYLNSETKDYYDERFKIIPVHPEQNSYWSDRLHNCVQTIKEDYILCIEDECLIEEKVDVEKINQAISMLDEDPNIACVWLVHVVPGNVTTDTQNMPFREKEYDYRTLINQQVCLWRRKKWLKYIKPKENPWEYECLGSARGRFENDRFFVVDVNEPEVVKYGYGFIVYRGYWCKEEKERLEKKLGLKFDENARKTKTRENIDALTNRNLLFYNRLRFQKWIILFKKKLFHTDYSRPRKRI